MIGVSPNAVMAKMITFHERGFMKDGWGLTDANKTWEAQVLSAGSRMNSCLDYHFIIHWDVHIGLHKYFYI